MDTANTTLTVPDAPAAPAAPAQFKVKGFKGVIKKAYGKPLSKCEFRNPDGTPGVPLKSIGYATTFVEILTPEAIPGDEMPKPKDVQAWANNKRKAIRRQKAVQDALDAAGVVKPTMETDVEMQIGGMVKSMLASGKYNEVTARVKALEVLGLTEADVEAAGNAAAETDDEDETDDETEDDAATA